MNELTLPTMLTLPTKLPQVRSLPTIGAVATLPRLPSFNAEAVQQAEEQQLLLAQQRAKEANYKKVTGLKDPNDPYALNSAVDAIFNRKAKEKHYGEFAETLHEIPVLGDIITAVPALFETVWLSPTANLLTGDLKAYGINGLTNFSETMDILANPVKSLITPLVNQDTTDRKYQLPWYERLGASIGFTDEGRYNYDYDVGFWLGDMALEIVSDPINIIELIGTMGASSLKEPVTKALTKLGQEAANNLVQSGVKIVNKFGKELSEEASKKVLGKKLAKSMLQQTIDLKKTATKISALTKRAAKQSNDTLLKTLSQNLDEALRLTKGTVGDSAKSIVNSITDQLGALVKAGDLDERTLKTITELLKETDNFNQVTKYSVKDLLEAQGFSWFRSDSLYNATDPSQKILTDDAALKLKGFNAAYSTAISPEETKAIREAIETLLNDPYSVRKYKHRFSIKADSLEDILSKIDLTDYVNAVNAHLQHSATFKLMSAMDALSEGANAIDNIILKAAFASGPVGQALLALGKTQGWATIKKHTTRWFLRGVSSVMGFFMDKTHTASVLLDAVDMQTVFDRTLKEFTVLSSYDFTETNFDKELSKYVYDDALMWLKGQADKHRYVPEEVENAAGEMVSEYKAKNILLLEPEEMEEQIWGSFLSDWQRLGIDRKDCVDYFFNQLRLRGAYYRNPEFNDWDISKYIDACRIDEVHRIAKENFASFNEALDNTNKGLGRQGGLLKFLGDIDLPSKGKLSSVGTHARQLIDELYEYSKSADDLASALQADFGHIIPEDKPLDIARVASFGDSLDRFIEVAEQVIKVSEELKVATASKLTPPEVIAEISLRFEEAVLALRNRAKSSYNIFSEVKRRYAVKDSVFMSTSIYKTLRAMSSPYFGRTEHYAKLHQVRYEIQANIYFKNMEILKNKDFQDFITSLKPGGYNHKLLEQARISAEQKLNKLKKQNKNWKDVDFQAQNSILRNIAYVRNTVDSIDAYVDHLALIKQSGIPDELQQAYLEVLQEYNVKRSVEFKRNLTEHTSEIIRRVNDRITTTHSAHTYTLDYFALRLLKNDEYKSFAEKYLNSTRSTLDESEFIEQLFKAELLPELQKTKDILDPDGNVTGTQYVHPSYRRHENRKYVYVSFNTSGRNGTLDRITECGINCPDANLKWQRSASTGDDEIQALLDIYNTTRKLKEDNKELTFISFGKNDADAEFLQARYLAAMETVNLAGDPNLWEEYRFLNYKAVKTPQDHKDLQVLFERAAESVPEEKRDLFVRLAEAQRWMYENYSTASLNIVDLVKKFEGVPTVGEYAWDIRRFLFSYVNRQATNNGMLNLNLTEDFLDRLSLIPPYQPNNYDQAADKIYELFKSVNKIDSQLSSKGNSYSLSGRFLLDDSFYNKSVYSPDDDGFKALLDNQVEVYDPTELLDLRDDGCWYYQGHALPETVVDSKTALRYLRKQGIVYAPKWRALSPQQQFAACPVMLNGKVCIVPMEDTQYLTVKKFIDADLVRDFFEWSVAKSPEGGNIVHSYPAQHTLTVLAQQMSEVIASIKNPKIIEEVSDQIDRVYDLTWNWVQQNISGFAAYGYLKKNTDVYHKYAALVVALRDDVHDSPRRLIQRELEKATVEPVHFGYDVYEAAGFTQEMRKFRHSLEDHKKLPPTSRGALQFDEWKKTNNIPQNPKGLTWSNPSDFKSFTDSPMPSGEWGFSEEIIQVHNTYLKTVKRAQYQYPELKGSGTEEAYNALKKEIKKVKKRRERLAEKLLKDKNIIEGSPAWNEAMLYLVILEDEYDETIGAFLEAQDAHRVRNAALIKEYNDKLYNEDYKAYIKHFIETEEAEYAKNYADYEAYLAFKKELEDIENARVAELNEGLYLLENRKRERAAKLVMYPDTYVTKESGFQKLFKNYSSSKSLGYVDNTILQSKYNEHILNLERYTSIEQARHLKQAITEANADMLQSTKAFKLTADKNNIYVPSLQRHAVIGYSQVELNDYKMHLIEKYQSEPEFETFVSCDKQVVNNLEDLVLLQVLALKPDDLRSFVYHQGKGCVIIPVAAYLKDTARHSIDMKTPISKFIKDYANYQDGFITVKRHGDNLIIYANDYLRNLKQNIIPYKALQDTPIDVAFKAAFGYPHDLTKAREMYLKRIQSLGTDTLSPAYVSGYNKALDEVSKRFSLGHKQTSFLFTHWDDIEELRKRYIKQQKVLKRLSTDYDHQYNQYLGGYGRVITQDELNNIHELLPTSIRKELYGVEPLDKTTVIKIYSSEYSGAFNFTTLGRAEYRHEFEPFATSDYHKIMADTYRNLSSGLSTLSQYAKFFDIDSPLNLRNFMAYATPEEIFVALKQTEDYTISYLGVDKKGLPKLLDIDINSVEDVKFALDKGASILPNITHSSVVQTVNAKRWSNDSIVSQVFHKVTYFNKMYTLIANTLGFVFRNTVDSTMKNFLVTKDPTLLNDYASALKYLHDYEETVSRLFQLSPDNPFRPSIMQEVFNAKAVPLDEETFMLIHNFLESGPSAGPINSVAEFYLSKAEIQPNAVQKFFDWVMNPTKQVEQVTRLSLYLNSIKKGMTNTDAFRIIAKTHFDYATKTTSARLIELVIPFFTFQTKNFLFWVDMLEKNPVLAAVFVDMFTSQWNWEDIDFERINAYQSQLNHMLQSNIQLNKKGLTLKVNPSYMDPVSLVLNPIDSLAGRISPIFKFLTDGMLGNDPYNYEYGAGSTLGAVMAATNLTGLSPAGAAIGIGSQTAQSYKSGYKSYQRTGSVMPLIAPSVFGSVKTPTQYGRASYTNSRAFSDPEKRRPRQVSVYHQLYTDSGKNRWQLRYLPVDNFTIHWRIRESTNLFR